MLRFTISIVGIVLVKLSLLSGDPFSCTEPYSLAVGLLYTISRVISQISSSEKKSSIVFFIIIIIIVIISYDTHRCVPVKLDGIPECKSKALLQQPVKDNSTFLIFRMNEKHFPISDYKHVKITLSGTSIL